MPTLKQYLIQRTRNELITAATELADADQRLRHALVEARRAAGLTQQEVADLLGVKQSTISQFERYDNDPRLSTIRRYALAVGANVRHEVSRAAESEWRATVRSTPKTSTVTWELPSFAPVGAPVVASRVDLALAA